MGLSSCPDRRLDIWFPFWDIWLVRVISRRALRSFAERFPDALEPLLRWANATESASWHTPGDIRRTFNSADFVEELTVFDIGGNKYRLIAYVHYRRGVVFVKEVLTHKEYDKGGWNR
jgi:mRNA interferase HigB